MKKSNLYCILAIVLLLTACKSDDPAKPDEKTSGYKVGDLAQGGVVFYVDATGSHGLVYPAPALLASYKATWSPGSEQFQMTTGVYVPTDSIIGSGKNNTTSIVSKYGSGNYAASICDNLVSEGYSDWYLPSILELLEILKYADVLPGIQKNVSYRSSTLGSRVQIPAGATSFSLRGVSTPSGGWIWFVWSIDMQTRKLFTDTMSHANGGKNNEAFFIPIRSF